MKCIKSTEGQIVRAKEKDADKLVKTGKWKFCGKQEWKKEVRDSKKESTDTKAVEQTEVDAIPKKTKKTKDGKRAKVSKKDK